jgi:hypothetical protein
MGAMSSTSSSHCSIVETALVAFSSGVGSAVTRGGGVPLGVAVDIWVESAGSSAPLLPAPASGQVAVCTQVRGTSQALSSRGSSIQPRRLRQVAGWRIGLSDASRTRCGFDEGRRCRCQWLPVAHWRNLSRPGSVSTLMWYSVPPGGLPSDLVCEDRRGSRVGAVGRHRATPKILLRGVVTPTRQQSSTCVFANTVMSTSSSSVCVANPRRITCVVRVTLRESPNHRVDEDHSPLDCLRCGACCRSGEDGRILIPPEDLMRWRRIGRIDLALRIQPGHFGLSAFATRADGSCTHLGTSTEPNACQIYEDRGTTCRDFKKGSPQCLEFRRDFGVDG